MERKVVSDKTRLLRGFLVLVAMLAGGMIAGWTNHETFRFWLKFTFVPLTVGGCIAFLVMYFAMRNQEESPKDAGGLLAKVDIYPGAPKGAGTPSN